MAQVADSKGEYSGTTVRDDAALAAWLARHTEAALEPDLPIIDPHHHFWDSPHRGSYLLPGLLSDIGGGHNIVSTVFLECRAMYRKEGPRHMAAAGEVEFVAGLAAMSASGGYGPNFGDIWEVFQVLAANRGLGVIHSEDNDIVMHMYGKLIAIRRRLRAK